MSKVRKTIGIVIPAYNEEKVLSKLYERLILLRKNINGYNLKFIFVNDGSRDKTLSIIKEFAASDEHVLYISFSRNFGKEIGMIAGLDAAVICDATIIIDADLQDPPELIPEMISLWEQGYDDVYARRRSRSGESFLKKATSKLFYRVLQKSTRVEIQTDTGDFRLLSQRCVESLCKMRESQRYTKGLFSWVGYKKIEILYDRDPRAAGETKWNYWRLLDLAIEGITSFTTFPLRISTIMGLIVSASAFIYLAVVVVKAAFMGSQAAGYPSLMSVILFLGGVQLISLGIIGEYVGRIFNETKQRPLYFIDETNLEDPSRK